MMAFNTGHTSHLSQNALLGFLEDIGHKKASKMFTSNKKTGDMILWHSFSQLSWWPAHLATTKDMQVKVVDRLAALLPIVDH